MHFTRKHKFPISRIMLKVTKKRRVNKLWVFDWLRLAKITSYSEHFEKICLYVQFSADQSFTRNCFVTFLHESANRKIMYCIAYSIALPFIYQNPEVFTRQIETAFTHFRNSLIFTYSITLTFKSLKCNFLHSLNCDCNYFSSFDVLLAFALF